MFRFVALLCFVASITAFAPSTRFTTKTSLGCETQEQTVTDLNLEEMFDTFEAADAEITDEEVGVKSSPVSSPVVSAEDLPGVSFPMKFWDPAQYTLDASPAQIKFYQEAEIKHGRIGMLAVLGIIFGEKFPLFYNGQITGPAIYQFQQADAIFPAFWLGVTMLIAFAEGGAILSIWEDAETTFSDVNGVAKLKADHVAGDLGFDPLKLAPKDAMKMKEMRTKEINNGRLAMLAAAGLVAQEYVTGVSVF